VLRKDTPSSKVPRRSIPEKDWFQKTQCLKSVRGWGTLQSPFGSGSAVTFTQQNNSNPTTTMGPHWILAVFMKIPNPDKPELIIEY
jgi:hypothetical protein